MVNATKARAALDLICPEHPNVPCLTALSVGRGQFMPNAEKMRATQALVEANLARWDQASDSAMSECGVSFCWFGWGAIAEGYRVDVDADDDLTGLFVNDRTYDRDLAYNIVVRTHKLTHLEAAAIYYFRTRNITELKERVESVIRGAWR